MLLMENGNKVAKSISLTYVNLFSVCLELLLYLSSRLTSEVSGMGPL